MTDAEAQKLVTVLVAAFPQSMQRLDEEGRKATMGIYRRMLVDLDYPAANAAVERLLATCKFMPSIAEIREVACELTVGPKRAGGEAWGDVLRAIGRVGRYRSPAFEDPVTSKAVASLGWVNLCDSENQQADRARFVDLYDKLATDHRRETVAGQLPAGQRYKALLEERGEGGNPFRRVLELVDRAGGE